MKACCKVIDIYPQSFQFTYKGDKKKKTVWGGIISLITIITLIIIGVITGKDIYLKNNPNVIIYEKTEPYSPIVRFNNDQIKLGFSISKDFKFLWDESIFQVIPIFYVSRYRGKKYIYKEYFLELEDCKRQKNESLYYQKCIRNMDLYLGGSWSENFLTSFSLKLMKCNNETIKPKDNIENEEDREYLSNLERDMSLDYLKGSKNQIVHDKDYKELDLFEYLRGLEKRQKENSEKKKIVCKSPEEIEKVLGNNYWLNIFNQYVHIQPKNFDNPFRVENSLDYYIFGQGYFKYIDIFFQNYGLATDRGIIFEDVHYDQIKFGVGYINPDFSTTRSSDLLLQINYMTSPKHQIISRSYIKLQQIFANLGGFINIT